MLQKKLFFILTFCISFSAFAQVKTEFEIIKNFAAQHRIKENIEYAKAVATAKEKGWPIYRVAKNGTVFALQYIDQLGNPVYYNSFNNTIAAATTQANQLWPGGSSGLNLSGSSAAVSGKLGIWDGGLILKSHVELVGRVLQKDSASSAGLDDHATHTTGTMIASGVNPIAKGMSFGMKQLIAYDFVTNEISEMAAESPNLIVSNHSYGITGGWAYDGAHWSWNGDTTISKAESYLEGRYDNSAMMYDSIAYNAPNYTMVFAAGNSNGNNSNGQGPAVGATYYYNQNPNKVVARTPLMGDNLTYGSVSMGQTAKNIITVGAVNGIPGGYVNPSNVKIASFSSWGPTDDGRIKPDIVADGVNVVSSVSSSNTAYASLSGTSMASPNAAGSLLLLQEYYNQKHGNFMRAATLRALAIHTADEAGSNNGPDFVYGYGLLNVLKASNVITSSYANKTDTIIEKTLSNATPYTINVIASGSGPLKATLVWTDPKGTVDNSTLLNSTVPLLVNDLDLRIASGSRTYYPWILDPNNPTVAATRGDDKLNNIEQILVDSTVPGKSYSITVSNKGTLARSSQAYSLIISGIGGTATCTSAASSSTVGAAIDSVVFAGIANKNTSNAGYNNYTNIIGSIEAAQTIPMTLSVRTRDASSNPRIVRAYIDYNGNGVFEATEQVAQSATINSSTGKTTVSVTTSPNITVGSILLMRVIVQETSNAADINPCGTYANGETEDYQVKVVSPSNDVAVTEVSLPNSANCGVNAQYITIAIQNKGANTKANVPLTAVVKSGATTILTATGTYPLLAGGSSATYTFQKPFTSASATAYTITAYSSVPGDQNKSNDTANTSLTTLAKPSTPAGNAEICSNSVILLVNSPSSSSNYLWYDTPTTIAAIAVGSQASSSVITSDKKYYLTSGVNANVGLTSKNNFPSAGNYQIGGNYLSYNSTIPMVLENARIFTRGFGTVSVYAVDFDAQGNGTVLDVKTIDVYPTLPNYIGSSSSVNDPTDTGAIFNIGLNLPSGSHSIYLIATDTILFRNNNITGSPYPFSIPNVFSITGNSAGTSAQNFYYYLYNMNVRTTDCVADRGTVTATVAAVPTVTQSGDSLVSSAATGNQWYLNNVMINAANGKSYKPTKSGSYSVIVNDSYNCSQSSAPVNFVVTAVQNANSAEIGLKVSPNPTNGVFNVSFYLSSKADVNVGLISTSGQNCLNNTYANFSGQFSQQFTTNNLAEGTYILKVQANNKVYKAKVVIIR